MLSIADILEDKLEQLKQIVISEIYQEHGMFNSEEATELTTDYDQSLIEEIMDVESLYELINVYSYTIGFNTSEGAIELLKYLKPSFLEQ